MEAHTYQVGDILKPERRFIIPTFQRDYEWTESAQWQLLFEDLEATTERLLDARKLADHMGVPVAQQEKKVAPHFLGAIVCDSMPFPAGGLAMKAVIDGQQRLTTMQLLIRGLLDVLQECESPRAPQVRRMLRNPDDAVSKPEEVYKLWPRRLDRKVWPTAVDDIVPAYTGQGDHLYLKARAFFANSTRTAIADVDGQVDPVRLEAMVDALTGLFKIVSIDLDDNDDAQVIFEVLNGRQTQLSAIDLVKNLLFLRGELAQDDVETLYETYWSDFDDAWWKVNVGTGHAQRGRRDVLLSVWLTAVTAEDANVGHLYREVRTYLDVHQPKTEEVLIELSSYAKAYRAIYANGPVETPAIRTAYDHITGLRNLTAIPLLAWLRTVSVEVLSVADHERAVRAVESWTLRRMLVNWQTRQYAAAYLVVQKAGQAAAVAGENIADAIVAAFAHSPNRLQWPTDQDVADAFATYPYYEKATQERIRLILSVIDVQLRANNANAEPASFEYSKLEIEHLMPQKWEEHWPLSIHVEEDGGEVSAVDLATASADTLAAAQAMKEAAAAGALESAKLNRRQHLHRLGNLTLVTSGFNKDLRNYSWDVKRPAIAAESALQLNKLVGATPAWDEGAIQARAMILAVVMCRVWPAPEDLGWESPVEEPEGGASSTSGHP